MSFKKYGLLLVLFGLFLITATNAVAPDYTWLNTSFPYKQEVVLSNAGSTLTD
jgi:hypothetical protein